MNPRATPRFTRFTVLAILLSLFATFLPMVQVTEALSFVGRANLELSGNPGGGLSSIRSVSPVETRYDLVVILVDEEVWGSSSSGTGPFSFLGVTSLAEKIQTYAQDVQASLPWTKSVIVTVSPEDSTVDIQRFLEKLYFEGDLEDSDPTQLAGVVMVGEVPLPVVNKNGYRFVSLLPYTDFEVPSYIVDVSTHDFIPNVVAENLQAEVWHGVIVPPLDGQEGVDLLAAYFDKNHSFHSGDEEATTFDEKSFIADFVTESHTLNSVAYGAYDRYTDLWEELAYYRYTNDLVEDVFTKMQDSVEGGDLLDNDFDGYYDEEASNGTDDDGDGLVDEDIGDGFFGIDNDGDCLALAESQQDSNGDGRRCNGGTYDEEGNEESPPDTNVDEDGPSDNNNDKNWVIELYRDADSPVFEDHLTDEDPPGDTTGGEDADGDGVQDGDGCPGFCGKDDNGDADDADGDGFPNGLEVVIGSDLTKENLPWRTIVTYSQDVFGLDFSSEADPAEAATAYWEEQFTDQFFGGEYKDNTCYGDDGLFHPEWDDDEDGFCDEDGSTEDRLWLDQYGTPYPGSCAYNDGDCDGTVDEDTMGIQPRGMFDDLPDLQAKKIIEGLTKKYVELFNEPQGVWNRVVGQTGRYKTKDLDENEVVHNDYDTPISLISKKDEYTLQYLRIVNDTLESLTNGIVRDNLAKEIPIIGMMELSGEYTVYEENEDGDVEESDPEDICTFGDNASLETDACLQFFNAGSGDTAVFDSWDLPYNSVNGYVSDNRADLIYMNGKAITEIDSPKECTLFAGTYEEGGQLSQFNTMYSTDQLDLNVDEVQAYKNCVPEFASYLKDIPELCGTATAVQDLRNLGGAISVDELADRIEKPVEEAVAAWEVGPEACYEFREFTTYSVYLQSSGRFNDWLSEKLRAFQKNSGRDEEEYTEFLEKVQEKREEWGPDTVTLRKHFQELDLISSSEDITYTVTDMMNDKVGYQAEWNDDDIDTYLALYDGDTITVSDPQYGSGTADVARITIQLNRAYLMEDYDLFTMDSDDAKTISSVYTHTEPTSATLNAQAGTLASPNMPIDATRGVAFIDFADDPQTLNYVNVFDASTLEEVTAQLETLASAVGDVSRGSTYVDDVEAFMDTLNTDQLEDALTWYRLSIDQKHDYVLSHYLGDKEPITSKARNGYEMVSIIADGDADEMVAGFNPVSNNEGDLEFIYRDLDLALLALDEEQVEEEPEPLTELSNTTPVPLWDWFPAIESWLKELTDSTSNFANYEGGSSCGDASDFAAEASVDADGSGVPDGAESTTSLLLSSEDYNVLEPNSLNGDLYIVSVSAKQADGSLNALDSTTEVSLEIVSGAASAEIFGSTVIPFSSGVASFSIKGLEPGTFTLKATSSNRDDVTESNTLSGSVEEKHLKVTTFTRENLDGTVLDSYEGTRIEVRNENGDIVAILDPETGALELRGAQAKVVEATPELPTRVRIQSEDGLIYGVFFLIPEVKTVAVGEGAEGVFVEAMDSAYTATAVENGVGLFKGTSQIGLVTDHGQIAVSEGYRLDFENPSEINLYEPIHVLDGSGNTFFTVLIKHPFTEGSLVEPTGTHEEYLSLLPGFWVQRAVAAVVIPDSDADGLDDLEEWVIGTDGAVVDTDSDSYADGTEIFAGYSALEEGEKLFTDIDSTHEAYFALATLYLRGIVKGYPDGSFKPDSPITREEFVKIDLGAICKDCDSYEASYEESLMALYNQDAFPDTDINPDLLACVAEAKTSGIVSGYAGGAEAGFFLPGRYISVAEATKVLVETAGFESRTPRADEVWYAGYVDAAKSYDLFPDGTEVTTAWLEGYITRAEFVMMAVNLVEAQDCRAVDTDGDYLSDVEETVLYGTDPTNPDTDFGGVTDFDEVVRGSDPLDAVDDFPVTDGGETDSESGDTDEDYSAYGDYEHDAGLYSVSSSDAYESIATSDDDGLSTVNVYTTKAPADGEAILYVRAELTDLDGNIYVEDSSSIVEFILSSSEYGTLDSSVVQMDTGIAETVFTTSQVAGELHVSAQLRDGSVPYEGETVTVYAGEPNSVDVDLESTVLPVGGQSVTDATLTLYDRYGNLANYGTYSATLDSTEVTLLDLTDEDAETPGTQTSVQNGVLEFRVLSSVEESTGTVTAALTEQPDIQDSVSLNSVDGLALSVSLSEPYLFAGSGGSESVGIAVVDANGVLQTGFQGDVLLSPSDPNYGSFESEQITLTQGAGIATFTVGTLAGTGSVLAESAGLEVSSASLTVKPSDIYELRIHKEDGAARVQAGEVERFVVEGYDAYGNVVSTDSSTSGTLRLTDSTSDFGTLSSTSFQLNQGSDSFSVNVGEVSGVLNMVASKPGLLAGTWGGAIEYFTTGEELEDMDPQMLYATVLGAAFGDVNQENYVAGWLLFNGKTQAISSLVSEPTPHKPLASVDAKGNITLAEDGMLTQTVEGAGIGLPTRMLWRSFPDQKLQAELFFVNGEDASYTASLANTDPAYTLSETDGATLLLKDSAALARVRKDGQIELLNPSLYLVVNGASTGLSLAVMENSEAVLVVNYDSVWTEDVSLLESDADMADWSSLDPGIYIKPTPDSEHSFEPVSSGNSSLSAQGLALVDPLQELSKEMQPSMGYTSLDQAEKDGTVGWEKENKNFLLFSAGNTVGASNLYYMSEVGIVLGDPTIKVQTPNEVNDLGYTEDVGTLISASQGEILQLVDIDYNGDEQMDVLVAYKDGHIDVLQNYDAATRLRTRGTLLNVENGIRSIDKGDFNADGLTDLLIVTEESCYAGEMCLYEYDNIGGGFTAKNLSFSEISAQPDQVEVVDLNADGYDDLVLADENMVLYTVWNSSGTLSVVDEIKDFGLETDPTVDLAAQVLLHYSGLSSGSVSLPLVVDASEAGNPELEDFLSNLALVSSFNLNTDGETTGSVDKKENNAFEYGNSEEFEDVFSVSKFVTDGDGESAQVGDTLSYTVTVQNVSGTTLNEVYLSDTVDSVFGLNEDSFDCSACTEVDVSGASLAAGDASRPFIYGPLDFANGAELSFTYSVEVLRLPELSLMVGNDLFGDYVDDNRPDIGISLDGNNTGELLVYYSDGSYTETLEEGLLLGLGAETVEHVNYEETTYSPEDSDYEEEYDTTQPSPFEDLDEDGIPDFMAEMDPDLGIPVPDSGYDAIAEVLGGKDGDGDGYYSSQEMFSSDNDADNDGLYDTIDSFNAGSDLILDPSLNLNPEDDEVELSEDGGIEIDAEVAVLDEEIAGLTDSVEAVVSMFTCSGGCLALPGSIAFLATGGYHDPMTGLFAGPDVGTPVFGIMPNPSYVCSGTACQVSSMFRLYIAPTTTLGLALAVCVSPYATGQCYAFNIPLLQALGVCDAINGFIADSLSKASEFVEENGSIAINVGGGTSTQSNPAPSGLSSSDFDSYNPPTSENMNIDIPGFPSIFTEWWKAQKHEFFKMLDLPDITFIYPDPKSIAAEFTGIRQKAKDNQENDAVDLDHEEKVNEMSSGILNLEKWLNMAHALPLIDIKTEKVYIHYPFITEEEAEIFQEDMQSWVVDTKTGFEAFKEQFELRELSEDLTDEEKEAYAELVGAVDEVITAVEANMAVLESYKDIPEKIFEIRNLLADYAKVIVCYLDAILDFTAGYLSENLQRVEAWAQFVVDLRKIVDGWQILIDISADLMDSCDKCTNQRFSGLQLLFSLFAFMPELPVIEMPKLPDIVIDVSHIQAGLDIVWPDVEFIPERINIPKLPRLVFPSATFNLDVDLDMDFDIPTLPEFNLEYELPQLPALTLPNLPSLPPPPSIPELDPTLSASLNIASNVLKIICIIRSGIIPTPENQLKARIEEITERPGGIMLPFDFAVTVEWPSFSLDFLKRVEINTYLNLNADFSSIFDVIDNLGAQSAELSQDMASAISQPLEDLAQTIQTVLSGVAEQTSIDADAEIEADLDEEDITDEQSSLVHPAVETAELYKDNPLVMQNLMALQDVMTTLQTQVNEWSATLPEEVRLTADERLLALDDPLLNRYDEILKEDPNLDAHFLASIQDTPLVGVLGIKNSLLSYVENLDAENARLLVMDDEDFFRTLAQENTESAIQVAGNESDEGYSTASEWNLNALETASMDEDVELSSEDDLPELEGLDMGQQSKAFNTGLYIYNSEEGVSTRLTAYAAEADEETHILFIDVDGDDDKDVVYSLGGDVYVKENYTESPTLEYVSTDPSEVTLADHVPDQGSMQNFNEGTNSYQEASFSFDPSHEATGYEFSLYDSLDAQEAEPDENIKRLLLLSEEENTPVTLVEGEEGSWSAEGGYSAETTNDATLPEVANSRLWVDSVSGSVLLKNAGQRTLIQENGELETTDSVVLQSITSMILELTYEDAEATMEVPAYTVLSFGNDTERTIRVESGSAYLIDGSELVEEQTLSEDMMLLPQELVELDGITAKATLMSSEGGVFALDHQESFVMDRLLSAESPSAQVELENGAYYTVGRALYSDGVLSTLSDNLLLNPQVCGDEAEPVVVVDGGTDVDGDGVVDLAIFSTMELSAAQSFDSNSEIIDAYWDLDDQVDADGDGVFNNDEESFGLTTLIGPYDNIDPKVVTVYVVDSAGNTANRTIDVNIYVPDIQIAAASPTEVSGTTDPLSPDFPFTLVREREGAWQELGDYSTDTDGNFVLPMEDSDLIAVYDADGLSIAEFNPVTKQVQILDEDYDVTFVTADSTWPSHLAVYEKLTGIVMGSFIFVADSSLPITRLGEPLSNYDLTSFNRVTAYSVTDPNGYDFGLTSITAHDDVGNLDFMITNTGNVTVFDSRYTVLRRDADSLDEPLILEVYDEGSLEMEVWPGTSSEVFIETTDDLNLPASDLIGEDHDSLSDDTRLYFEDISTDDALYTKIAELVERGVLEGYEIDDLRYFKPDDSINRAEFTKIILSILCIVPREEAKVLPYVFNDILTTTLWFYPYTKESYLSGLITGYLGETDGAGLAPFKPENTITTAEASKIVLEALDSEGIITLPDVSTTGAWYEPYIDIAQDLSPYMTGDVTAGTANFILTPEEAAEPNHVLTRYEFVEISVRVLQAYNCFDLDSDGDGLINYDEETIYGSDPYNPDTDAGGVDDGSEVGRGSDPLDGEDDFEDGSLSDVEPGIYAVREACVACPCVSQVDYAAELRPGDKVFAIIQNELGEIFGVSNSVTVSDPDAP